MTLVFNFLALEKIPSALGRSSVLSRPVEVTSEENRRKIWDWCDNLLPVAQVNISYSV